MEISNIKAVADSVMMGTDSVQGPAKMALVQAKSITSESSLKGMIEGITSYVPNKQINIGDKWASTLSISNGGINLLTTTDFKLKKISDNHAEISGDATIEPIAGGAPLEVNGMQISYDLRGLGKSTLTVDTKSGWVIKHNIKTHMQGNMGIKGQGQDMEMPMEIEGKTDIIAL
jgi:hypothetical protein